MAPGSYWYNISLKGYERLVNFHDQSQWIQRNSKQDVCHGSVFRHRVPIPNHLIACCDYKLARIVLSGSVEDNIQESDKTTRIQNLNLFPGVCSLLTYQTADPHRAKLRKHLYIPFSTSNLQKTTVKILNSGVRRLLLRLEDQAAKGYCVDMKKVSIFNDGFSILFKCMSFINESSSLTDCGYGYIRHSHKKPIRHIHR